MSDRYRADDLVAFIREMRLPGEGTLARRRPQIRDGVPLHETIMPALTPWAERLGVALPHRLA
jgi:hypothetical protein